MRAKRPRTRLYQAGDFQVGQILRFHREQAAYLTKVLRLKTGAGIGLFNTAAGEWHATLTIEGSRQVTAIIDRRICESEGPSGLILAFAPIKKIPLEWMIIKATELGIDAFQPIITDHTQAELGRLDRLKTLMIEASQQCERCRVPTLLPAQQFEPWAMKVNDLIAALEAGRAGDIRQVKGGKTLLVGPEGGFSAREIAILEEKATCVSLGYRVLKAETAALSLIAGVAIARGDFMQRPDFRP